MEVSQISFERPKEYDKDVHYLQYCLIYSYINAKYSAKTTALQLAVCWQHWSAGRQWRRIPTTHWKIGENNCWIRHGNQLGQEKTPDQRHQAKAIYTNIWINGKTLDYVDQFKYLGTSFPTNIKLYKSLVLSILLCGCESWTSTADLEDQSLWKQMLQQDAWHIRT